MKCFECGSPEVNVMGASGSICGDCLIKRLKAAPPLADLPVQAECSGHENSEPIHPAQGIAGVGLALIQMSLERSAADQAGAQLNHDLYERGCACVDAGRVWVLAEADRIVNGRRA